MKPTVLLAACIAAVSLGCAAANPVAPAKFDTKLLNLYSIGEQLASQLNYTPNSQVNSANQGIQTLANGQFPIASAVGTGAATAVNLTGQAILNNVLQNQNQSQLVL